MKNKNKIIITISLLFLMSLFGQAKAATYQENSVKVAKGLNYYIVQPVAGLVVFAGDNLSEPFKNYYFPKEVIDGIAVAGEKIEKILGTLFNKTGNILAGIANHLPRYSEVAYDTSDFLVKAPSVFKDWGKIFEVTGQALAIIPNNLPNLNEVAVSLGNPLFKATIKFKESAVITVAFLNESLDNLVEASKTEIYPYTQKITARAKANLEDNFNKVIGITSAKGASSPSLYKR